MLLFLLLGILKLSDALAGFSSSGVWSPAVMFMVAQGERRRQLRRKRCCWPLGLVRQAWLKPAFVPGEL